MNKSQELMILSELAHQANQKNLGDNLEEGLKIYSQISDPESKEFAELSLSSMRHFASGADTEWQLFAKPIQPGKPLSDIEILQLIGIERALHELCYAFEMVEISAEEGWGGSSRTRFYLNSIYHYVSSLFLIDTSRKSHRDLPMGGTIVRALHPLAIDRILTPVKAVLQMPFGTNISFGDAILRQRHSYLVHGTFSPGNVEYLVSETRMRDLTQQLLFREYFWDLFYQIVLLRLRILAIFSNIQINLDDVIIRYLSTVSKLSKD